MSTLPSGPASPKRRIGLRYSLRAIEVSGSSMSPKYESGDWLLFRSVSFPITRKAPKLHKLISLVGRVLVIERDEMPGILQIKRAIRVEESALWVEGDNKAASTDSRNWGVVQPHEIRGVVLLRYKRA
jgi:signal peptidase I